MSACLFCKKPTPDGCNYCEWECHVNHAIMSGGKWHTPNNLPIRCIRHDNLMLEHEHGDHPDYKFPVSCDFIPEPGVEYDRDEDWAMHETHALIYCDGYIVVTMYEHSYAMWSVADGMIIGGRHWQKDRWKLSDLALQEIRERWPS
jgi:hypothetical protein